jgi:CRP-like cAMP-binding protein
MTAQVPPHQATENRLLATLPPAVLAQLLPQLEPVELGLKQVLYERGKPITHVYFLCDGVGSLLSILEDNEQVEVATVGNEGMIGVPAYLGAVKSPLRSFCQIPGYALRMDVQALHDALDRHGELHTILQRYTQALFNQIAQSASCNRVHPVEQRCARWLLMTRDRVSSDTFPITHEFLAQMLGVRRATVTVVAGMLQKAGLISYVRGQMTIVDRPGLEAASCECYGVIAQEYRRLLHLE